MKKSIITYIPYRLTGSVDNFLFFSMLDTDMIVDRESEYHSHRFHKEIEPIILCFLEKKHTIDISHADSSYDG